MEKSLPGGQIFQRLLGGFCPVHLIFLPQNRLILQILHNPRESTPSTHDSRNGRTAGHNGAERADDGEDGDEGHGGERARFPWLVEFADGAAGAECFQLGNRDGGAFGDELDQVVDHEFNVRFAACPRKAGAECGTLLDRILKHEKKESKWQNPLEHQVFCQILLLWSGCITVGNHTIQSVDSPIIDWLIDWLVDHESMISLIDWFASYWHGLKFSLILQLFIQTWDFTNFPFKSNRGFAAINFDWLDFEFAEK